MDNQKYFSILINLVIPTGALIQEGLKHFLLEFFALRDDCGTRTIDVYGKISGIISGDENFKKINNIYVNLPYHCIN
ncbi:MAG TPA: hypothetical protein VEY70_23535 [Metabacillus sp.]|nr:hypothetical protein [Metabacillus sp.]